MDRQNSSSPQRFSLAKFLADWLDQRFTIPGTSIRIGLDPILGLIPGIGDMIANLAGSAIILIAAQYRLPKIVLLRMGLNVALNAIIGAIPVFGDIFSIWFRSNVKNAKLLERYVSAEDRVVDLRQLDFCQRGYYRDCSIVDSDFGCHSLADKTGLECSLKTKIGGLSDPMKNPAAASSGVSKGL